MLYVSVAEVTLLLFVNHTVKVWDELLAQFKPFHFRCMDWNNLDDTKFDVILFISAIHYADDQKGMLDFLMSRLNKNGILILEIGVVNSNENNFVKIKRITKKTNPTLKECKVCLFLMSIFQI